MRFSLVSLLSTLALASAQSSLPAIQVTGNALYPSGSSTRFYVRGVDYQPGGSSQATDPLADPTTCERDIPYFQELKINTIRVYTVDNAANHDECMQKLSDAGIYLLLDVNTPYCSINRADPAPSYNAAYLQNVFATIDAFKKYSNVLGFIAANEVINDVNSSSAAPYVKAVVRDMKSYMKAQSSRQIPVVYSAADIELNRWQQMEYLNCGDANSKIDFFSLNDYSWCGNDSSFQISGYQQNVQQYGNYSIPVILSEYGCNTVEPRVFDEISAIYSTEMSSVYSGGLVYEYSQEASNYGLVSISGNSVSTLQDFDNFKSQLAAYPDPSGAAGATTTRQAANCPAYDANAWLVSGSNLPALPSAASAYISSGAGTPLGTSAPDTQNGDNNPPPAGSNAASSASGSATAAAAAVSASSTSKKKSAANSVKAPSVFAQEFVVSGLLIVCSFVFGCLI